VVAETGREPKMCGKMTTTVETRAQEGMYNELCWTSLRSDKIYAARMSQLFIDICCGSAPDLSSKPAAAAVDRLDRQTDGRTFDRFMTLIA